MEAKTVGTFSAYKMTAVEMTNKKDRGEKKRRKRKKLEIYRQTPGH